MLHMDSPLCVQYTIAKYLAYKKAVAVTIVDTVRWSVLA